MRCASSSRRRHSVSPLRAAIPYAGSPPPSALAGAQGGAGLRRGAPGRCVRRCSDQGCAFIAILNNQARPAVPAVTRQRPVLVPGDRGPCFLHAARERGPLVELAGVPLTPLRFVRCTPTRSSPRSPAKPDTGPLNTLKCPPRLDPGRTAARCSVGPWKAAIARVGHAPRPEAGQRLLALLAAFQCR